MLKIALPNKGRLADDVRELFDNAGLGVRGSGARALSASLGGEFNAIFVRAQDIPEFVADGAADAGVTGWDLVSESGRALRDLLDLDFGRCRMIVATREDSSVKRVDDVRDGATVATSFPRLTRRFFEQAGRRVTVVPMSGATEIAPLLGIAEVIVDLTSTGSTMKMNGLREIGSVMESSARLITANTPSVDNAVPLEELTLALSSVVRARTRRYLMANVPRRVLAEVREVLPGINGPTVTNLLNDDNHVAVHAVVPAANIYRTVSALKALGCEGILVTRIERLLP